MTPEVEQKVTPHAASPAPEGPRALVTAVGRAAPVLRPQGVGSPCGCGGSGGATDVATNEVDVDMGVMSYVFAIGRVEVRFPSLSIEKEYAQANGRTDTAGKTDRQALHTVFAQRSNRYLARQVCWVLTVEGLDTYLLVPRDASDLDLLLETLRAEPGPTDVDVVIGIRGPIATPEQCNGLTVPIVAIDQVYSFDVDALIKSIPRPRA